MAKKAPRELEHKGFKAEILGASKACALFINGKLYQRDIVTLREARRQFISYANRHSN